MEIVIEELSQEKLFELLKKLSECEDFKKFTDEEKKMILNILNGEELQLAGFIGVSEDRWCPISIMNVRIWICEWILKYDLYSLVFNIDNNYENKIKKLSQNTLIGLSIRIRENISGSNGRRTLNKIAHSGSPDTPYLINRFGPNPFVCEGEWSDNIKTIVIYTLMDILETEPHFRVLVDNIDVANIESYKNKILISLKYIQSDCIRLTNSQMNKYQKIMKKYDGILNTFHKNGWFIDDVFAKTTDWMERFSQYDEMIKDKKTIITIYEPPSRELNGIMDKYIKDICDICYKYMNMMNMNKNMKNSNTEHIFINEIMDIFMRFGIKFDENLSEDEKKIMIDMMDIENKSVKERNRLTHEFFAIKN